MVHLRCLPIVYGEGKVLRATYGKCFGRIQPRVHAALANEVSPGKCVQGPPLPDTPRPLLSTERSRAVWEHKMNTALSLFVLLENMDTQSNLVFADDAAVQRVFAAA